MLDHVKIEGSQNLSEEARKLIYTKNDQNKIGPLVTKLRDELTEKSRDLSELTGKNVFIIE